MGDLLSGIKAEVLLIDDVAEREAYLFELLRFYLDPVPNFVHGVACLGLALSPGDVRMLHALDRRRGHFLTVESLQAAAMVDRPECDWGRVDAIPARVSHIRRRLSKMRVPAAIEFCAGVGYRLHASADFRFEREAAAVPARS